jgi:hypothetical protein
MALLVATTSLTSRNNSLTSVALQKLDRRRSASNALSR